MIQEFTRQNLREIEADILDALKSVSEKHGFAIKPAGGKFTAMTFTPKFQIELPNAKTADPHLMARTEMGLRALNLPADSIGKTFTSNGQAYIIDHIAMKRHKFPVIAKSVSNGKMYKFNEDRVRQLLQIS